MYGMGMVEMLHILEDGTFFFANIIIDVKKVLNFSLISVIVLDF